MDYEKIGFKCGIEAHQQLDTLKLYCNCPTLIRDEKANKKIFRRLRPVEGEEGRIDIAAQYEFQKHRGFIYEFGDDSSCLVELDEEPPHPMNQDALKIVLQVAKIMNAEIVDEIRPMRKIVIDGSNVSGFQRTALVAMNGFIETSQGNVGIETICIEEESAQRGETSKKEVHWKLARLGVPLIEIATAPDIKNPDHAKEVAEKIGMICRSTGGAKRGIGTIRQDVNVSIKGGNRVELKGFQELKAIPITIYNEIKRQQNLIKKGKNVETEVRDAKPDGSSIFLRPMPGAHRMYPETDVPATRITKGLIEDLGEVTLIEDRVNELAKLVNEDIVKKLIKEKKDGLFEEILNSCKNLKAAYIADLILSAAANVKKQFNIKIDPSHDDFKLICKSLDQEKISKESVLEILKKEKPVKHSMEKYQQMSSEDVEKVLKKIIQENEGAPFPALMGEAMKKLRGKSSGKLISDLLKKLMR